MVQIPKTEKKSVPCNMFVTPSMDKRLRAFAKRNGVSRSQAARFIIERFFDDNLDKTEGTPPKNESDIEIIKVAS